MSKVYVMLPMDEEDFGDTIILQSPRIRVFSSKEKAVECATEFASEGDPDAIIKVREVLTDDTYGPGSKYIEVYEYEHDFGTDCIWFHILEREVQE